MGNAIEDRASFNEIRYANCWEDADILIQAASPLKGKRCLSIASSGDNSLALLANDPSLVVAVDLSMAQLACVELRKAAFAELDYEEMLWFLGFTELSPAGKNASRFHTFDLLKNQLSSASRSFWDGKRDAVAAGIIYQGKFERYFKMFRNIILPLIHSRKKVVELLREKDSSARTAFYNTQWNTLRWRMLFRIFFSRFVMGRAGRDPEFFRYVEGSVAERILKRTRHALTVLETHNNPYLTCILTGGFGSALPYYARKEHFDPIRNNLERLELCNGTTDTALEKYRTVFDVFNLSDIFEYMNEQEFGAVAERIIAHAAPRARLMYWNMLVPRQVSKRFPESVTTLTSLSNDLFLQDKAFFYQSFFTDEVRK